MARGKKSYGHKRSSKIVRGLMAVTGKGEFVFNDAIVGGRSIKVWGWTQDIYQVAIAAMQRQGIEARLVTTPYDNTLRVHTKEA